MKITITLDPREVELAVFEYLKKNEDLAKTDFYINSLHAMEHGSDSRGPEITMNVELGIPF